MAWYQNKTEKVGPVASVDYLCAILNRDPFRFQVWSVVSKNFETDSDILSHGIIIVIFVYVCRIQRHVKFLVFLSSQNGFVDLKKSGKSTVIFLSIFSKKLPFGVNVFVTFSDKALRS